MPDAGLKMSLHPGGPPRLRFGERALAGRQPPFGSTSSRPRRVFDRGMPGSLGGRLTIPALRVQRMLRLRVEMLPERLPFF